MKRYGDSLKGKPIYFSLPEVSVLLARLRSDAPFSRLFTALYSGDYIPFDISAHDADIDAVAATLASGGFPGMPSEISMRLRELGAELARAEKVSPGTGESHLQLDADLELLERRLTEYLDRETPGAAGKLVITLLYGGGRVAPDIFREQEPQLYLVPFPAVQYGAGRLTRVRSEELFPDDDPLAASLRPSFEQWRRFYASAAGRGDVVLVYIG